jgi:hypothetical protein
MTKHTFWFDEVINWRQKFSANVGVDVGVFHPLDVFRRWDFVDGGSDYDGHEQLSAI